MPVTVLDVLNDVRSHLSDTGADVFTNAELLPRLQMAYREFYRAMEGVQKPVIQREAFYNLPAHTSLLYPSTMGVTDMDEPLLVEERGNLNEHTVTGCTIVSSTASVSTAPVAHGFATGNQVVLYGLGGVTGLSGLFTVTVTSPTAFTVNGAIAAGTYSSGGSASTSTEQFQQMDNFVRLQDVLITEQSSLLKWSWWDDAFHFPPANQVRQIRVVYVSSGTAPTATTDSITPDEARDYLSFRAAGLTASAHGADQKAREMNLEALGPTGQADASGGILRQILLIGIRSMQRNQYRRPPFRGPRASVQQVY